MIKQEIIWYRTADELPADTDRGQYVCTFNETTTLLLVWNNYYQCWDHEDEHGYIQYYCDADTVKLWAQLPNPYGAW